MASVPRGAAPRSFPFLESRTMTALSQSLARGLLAASFMLGSSLSPAATRHLDTEGGQVAYDDTGGSGPLVIAIPGMGDLRSQYRALAPALAQAGYRVVTMDVRGHGETSARWQDYSARAVGRDALALMRHLGASQAVILGNSFAAGSALWAAHEAPGQVLGTVLLGPIVRDAPYSLFTDALVRLGFAGPWRTWFWMTYWNSLFPLRKMPDHDARHDALADNLREPGRMDALRAMVRLSKADTEALLPQVRVPALVVMGSRDPDFGDAVAESRWLSQQLSARECVVDGAGHYPHLEAVDQVAPVVLEFLRGVAPVASTPPTP